MSTAAEPAAGVAAGIASKDRRRLAFIDACRGICAAVIAAHHLCLYGPLPEAAAALTDDGGWFFPLTGQAVEFLREHGRYAVQVFLVLGGFVQYLTFPRNKLSLEQGSSYLFQRYLRLAVPLIGVLALGLIAQFASATLRPVTPYIEEFSLPHFIAQIFFLQDIFGYGGLMPGHWYPAIDLQFAILFMGAVYAVDRLLNFRWLRRFSRDAFLLTTLGVIAIGSLFFWNRDSAHESWVVYFLGSYFLGILAAAVFDKRAPWPLFAGYVVILGCALIVDFRIRLVVALAAAVVLLLGGLSHNLDRWLNFRWLTWLGRISYSFFLIHTVVHWLVLSVGHGVTGTEPHAALAWMLLAYFLAIPAAWGFYQLAERPSLWLVAWWKQAAIPLPNNRETVAT